MSFIPLLALFVSILSLTVSATILYRDRKIITVDFNKSAKPIPDNHLIGSTENPNDKPIFFDQSIYVALECINPSKHDIAFFHLEAHDNNGEQLNILTKNSSLSSKEEMKYRVVTPVKMFNVSLPKTNHGTLKSNSYTKLDLFIRVDSPLESPITVSLKTANSFKNKKWQSHGCIYDLPNLDEKMLSTAEQAKPLLETMLINLENHQ
ncbi:hypothetical protein [Carnobacterium maltaromaticum]